MANRHHIVTDPFTSNLIRIKAAQLCRRRDFSKSDAEDLQQSMLVQLLEKCHLYDPARGSVEAFVTTVINSCVRMELRRRDCLKRSGERAAVSLERTPIECDGDSVPLKACIRDDDLRRKTGAGVRTPIDSLELSEAVAHAFRQLSRDDQELLMHIAEKGVASASREWTKRRGRTVSRRQVYNELAKMRDRFKASGLGPD